MRLNKELGLQSLLLQLLNKQNCSRSIYTINVGYFYVCIDILMQYPVTMEAMQMKYGKSEGISVTKNKMLKWTNSFVVGSH